MVCSSPSLPLLLCLGYISGRLVRNDVLAIALTQYANLALDVLRRLRLERQHLFMAS